MDELERIGRELATELSLEVGSVVKNRYGVAILQVHEGDDEFALKIGTDRQIDPEMPSPASAIRQEALVSRTLPPGPWQEVASSGECEGGAYILTPWLSGMSITLYLVSQAPAMRVKKFTAIVQGSFIALTALHNARTVHGDIQPEHLRLCDEGDPIQLIDFGSAARLGDRDAPKYRGGLMHYMPPEIARSVLSKGSAERTAKSDIYSLAASLAFAFDQQLLPNYPRDPVQMNVQEVLVLIADGNINTFTGAEDNVTAVLGKCLSHDPAQRPEAADALAMLIRG